MEMVGDKNETEKESRRPYGGKQEARKIEIGMGDLKSRRSIAHKSKR